MNKDQIAILTRGDLVLELRRVLGLSERQAARALSLIVKTMRASLWSGDEVHIAGFGRLSLSTTQARTWTSHKTGKIKNRPKRTEGVFQPGRWAKGFLK